MGLRTLFRPTPELAKAEHQVARHIEIWGHIIENNRMLRRFSLLCVALAFFGLAVGSFGVLAGLYWPRAFHVDADGQASYAGRLSEQLAPTTIEVRYVAKEFFRHAVTMNSLSVEADLATAFNLMTDSLRAQQRKRYETFEKDTGEEFVAFIKRQKMQTDFDFEDGRIEVRQLDGGRYSVRLRGMAKSLSVSHLSDNEPKVQHFIAVVTLVRCPRTEETPNGLLVQSIEREFFEKDDATADSAKEK